MLELKNLVFEVPVEGGVSETKRIIDDLSLTIEDGRFTVITGPNGGGKSTLAKLIMGIEQPTSGSIVFNGQDITHASITERAKLGIGYGFQQPARFKGMKVKKLLELAAGKRLAGLSERVFGESRPVFCGLSHARGGQEPFRRRGKAHRDCNDARARSRRWPSTTSPRRASTCGASTV